MTGEEVTKTDAGTWRGMHEQTSTTLNRYTHPSPAYVNRARDVFADFPLTRLGQKGPETT